MVLGVGHYIIYKRMSKEDKSTLCGFHSDLGIPLNATVISNTVRHFFP